MSRDYTVQCNGVSVSAVQDMLAAYAGATRQIQVLAIQIGANGQTTVGNYQLTLHRLGATVTAGSAGSAVTPVRQDPNDAAAVFTARANDTTQATSSTDEVVFADEFNPINGYYWQPPDLNKPPQCALGGAFTLSLDTIAGTLIVNATMWVREL